ncbi:hypothetical protein LRR18_16480 [Mangrovimonas sp. AS39]|uniref:hypothetical protein n=1 Tax=Mangrovimonas futianensis TaxID=2895523 RepID=UPI001E318546|nr:hypothetical protein [Mangrovimonas futianensis]MCF1193187.1 hypothetical protein [Mangrovimonas futianensis]
MDQRDIDLLSSSKLKYFFKLLERTSYQAQQPWPMAALIAKGTKIIVCAPNKRKTHPESQVCKDFSFGFHKPGTHAEICCLLSLERDFSLRNHDLYVYRRRNNGAGLAKPCINCMNVILSSTQLRRIIWSTGNEETPYEMMRIY